MKHLRLIFLSSLIFSNTTVMGSDETIFSNIPRVQDNFLLQLPLHLVNGLIPFLDLGDMREMKETGNKACHKVWDKRIRDMAQHVFSYPSKYLFPKELPQSIKNYLTWQNDRVPFYRFPQSVKRLFGSPLLNIDNMSLFLEAKEPDPKDEESLLKLFFSKRSLEEQQGFARGSLNTLAVVDFLRKNPGILESLKLGTYDRLILGVLRKAGAAREAFEANNISLDINQVTNNDQILTTVRKPGPVYRAMRAALPGLDLDDPTHDHLILGVLRNGHAARQELMAATGNLPIDDEREDVQILKAVKVGPVHLALQAVLPEVNFNTLSDAQILATIRATTGQAGLSLQWAFQGVGINDWSNDAQILTTVKSPEKARLALQAALPGVDLDDHPMKKRCDFLNELAARNIPDNAGGVESVHLSGDKSLQDLGYAFILKRPESRFIDKLYSAQTLRYNLEYTPLIASACMECLQSEDPYNQNMEGILRNLRGNYQNALVAYHLSSLETQGPQCFEKLEAIRFLSSYPPLKEAYKNKLISACESILGSNAYIDYKFEAAKKLEALAGTNQLMSTQFYKSILENDTFIMSDKLRATKLLSPNSKNLKTEYKDQLVKECLEVFKNQKSYPYEKFKIIKAFSYFGEEYQHVAVDFYRSILKDDQSYPSLKIDAAKQLLESCNFNAKEDHPLIITAYMSNLRKVDFLFYAKFQATEFLKGLGEQYEVFLANFYMSIIENPDEHCIRSQLHAASELSILVKEYQNRTGEFPDFMIETQLQRMTTDFYRSVLERNSDYSSDKLRAAQLLPNDLRIFYKPIILEVCISVLENSSLCYNNVLMAAELLKDLVEEKYHSNYQTLVTQSLDDILQHQREYPGHYIDDNIHPEERFRYPLPDISKAQELRAYFAGLDS